MISALGPLEGVFTWLTLALPAQTEQRKLSKKYSTESEMWSNTIQAKKNTSYKKKKLFSHT